MPAVRQPTILVSRDTVVNRGDSVGVIVPIRNFSRGTGPAMFARPRAGKMPQNLFLSGDPANIPNSENRPEPVGYNAITPVTHIAAKAVQGQPGVGVLSRDVGASSKVSKTYQSIRDPHHYAKILTEQSAFSVPTTAGGVLCLPEPDGVRAYLAVRNTSATANVYLAFGNTPTTQSVLRLTANQIFLWDTSVPQGDMYALADAASATISFAFANLNY